MNDSRYFTTVDLKQLRSRGLDTQAALDQLRAIKEGPKPQRLLRPCSLEDGIHTLSEAELLHLSGEFEKPMAEGRAMKFVAASGAATRMFRLQSALLESGRTNRAYLNEAAEAGDAEAREFLEFVADLPRFALFEQLEAEMASRGFSLEESLETGDDYRRILTSLLGPDGLAFGELPKGMIPFHAYADGPRTAFEEQLIEGTGYVQDRKGKARIHFTVASHHLSAAKKHIEEGCAKFADLFETCFEVAFSVQKESTDSVAIDAQGRPLRDAEGHLVFRPSGHGALLDNLNSLGGDIVFLKTIDNILPERFNDMISLYKKALGGLLIRLQEEVYGYLERLSAGDCDLRLVRSVEEFLREMFFFQEPTEDGSQKERAEAFRRYLHRPLRVCGVVKHEGEPGGAPFWVSDSRGRANLQIVESAQVDLNQPDQRQIWETSEYFNPVDIVCGLHDFRGAQFDLFQYRDASAGFVTTKHHEGKQIRALELPGLWNGSMAFWNTVFVEVPKSTFHAVKTIMDLLHDAHRTRGKMS